MKIYNRRVKKCENETHYFTKRRTNCCENCTNSKKNVDFQRFDPYHSDL